MGYGWRQEAIAANAQKISELGNQLYERIATLGKHFVEMGSNLERCVSAYNKLAGARESKVLVAAREFKELGATAKEELPELENIDTTPRLIQSIERLALSPNGAPTPEEQPLTGQK